MYSLVYSTGKYQVHIRASRMAVCIVKNMLPIIAAALAIFEEEGLVLIIAAVRSREERPATVRISLIEYQRQMDGFFSIITVSGIHKIDGNRIRI